MGKLFKIYIYNSQTTSSRLGIRACAQNCSFSTINSRSKEQFVRDKVNINIVTLGSEQHGKTWLASELSRVMSEQGDGVQFRSMDMIDQSVSERENKRSENATHMELWSKPSKYRLTFADLPGNMTYIKNTLNHLAHADVALLVISPELGVDANSRLYCQLASHFGVKVILPVIVLRPDTDQETLELIKMEISDLSNVEEPQIISKEKLMQLVENIENCFQQKAVAEYRDSTKPFYMAVEQVGKIPSRGMFCAGRVLQGTMTTGSSSLEIFFNGQSTKINVREMEIHRKVTDTLIAGDRGGAFIRPKQDIELKRGAVIYDSKSKPIVRDQLEVSLKSVTGGNKVMKGEGVLFHSTVTDGRVTLLNMKEFNCSDDNENLLTLKLSQKMLIAPNDKIVFRNQNNFYAGIVKD